MSGIVICSMSGACTSVPSGGACGGGDSPPMSLRSPASHQHTKSLERRVQHAKEDVSVVQGQALHSAIILGCIRMCKWVAEPFSSWRTILGQRRGGRGWLFASGVYIGFVL